MTRTNSTRQRFWTSIPAHANAIDLFAGEWASDLAEVVPGVPHAGTPMFHQDPRPRQAAHALGANDRFDGFHILELGPLEGAHSYQLEQLGAARVTAIESNADAFTRCLVVKNMLGLDRTTYLLGDCLRYLETSTETVDLVFASGILYHMEDPVELIRLMAARSERVFIWSQYYDPNYRYANGKPLPHRARRYQRHGLDLSLHELAYRGRFRTDFFGGNRPKTHWLTLDGIIAALRHFGLAHVTVIEDDCRGARGPAATIAASRT